MKIGFITNKFNAGGGSDFSLDLWARSLSQRGHIVEILVAQTKSKELRDTSDKPYTISTMNLLGMSNMGKTARLRNRMESLSSSFDLFHIFTPVLTPVGGLYRKLGGSVPIIGRLNGYSLFCTNPNKMNGTCYRNCGIRDKYDHDPNQSLKRLPDYIDRTHSRPKIADMIDKFLAVSPSVKDIYASNGISGENIAVIPSFVDPELNRDDVVERSLPNNKIDLLYVGRLERSKGVDILLKAMFGLSTKYRLDVVGDGPMFNELKKLSSEISNPVNLHGWVDHDDVPEYYQNADLFVHPGRWPEPSGRTILEALQFKLPLITSDIGGPPWYGGEASLQFESGNVDDLEKVIRKAGEKPEIYNEMTSSMSQVLNRLSPEAILPKIEEEYAQVL